MKTNFKFLLIGMFGLVFAVGCGKLTPEQQKQKQDTTGVYRMTNARALAADMPYFVITPDKGLYSLQKKGLGILTAYGRDYIGDIRKAAFSFDGSEFSSGTITGKKIESNEGLPEPISLLKTIVERSQKLKDALAPHEIDVEVRLAQTNLSFVPKQVEILDVLLADVTKLATTMKAKKLGAVWVNDHINQELYELESTLRVPAGVLETPAKAVANAFR